MSNEIGKLSRREVYDMVVKRTMFIALLDTWYPTSANPEKMEERRRRDANIYAIKNIDFWFHNQELMKDW